MFSNSQLFYSNGNKYHVTMSYGDSTQFYDDTKQLVIHVLCKTTNIKYCDTWNDEYELTDVVTNKQIYEVFSDICKSNNKKNYKYKLDFYPFEDYVSIRVNIKNKKGFYKELFDFVVNVKNDYESIQQSVLEYIYPITINLRCLIFFKKLNSLVINRFIYNNFNIIPKLNIKYLTVNLMCLFGSTPSHVFEHFGVVKPNNSLIMIMLHIVLNHLMELKI